MSMRYQQTVIFDNGGWLQIDAHDDPEHPIASSDLLFVIGLAEQCANFEYARIVRRQTELTATQRAARLQAVPICWPGFRPTCLAAQRRP